MRLPITATLPDDADSISGVLDHGFELYARSFWRTSGFFVLASLPNAALGLVIGELQGSFASMAAGGAFGTMAARFGWVIPIYVLNLWFTLSLYNAAYYRTGLIARGRDERFWACAKYGFRIGHKALGLALISMVLIFVAMMLSAIWVGVAAVSIGAIAATAGEFGPFIGVLAGILVLLPPAIIISVAMVPIMLAPCALALRREGVFAALGTGFRLMGRHFWRNVIVMTVPGVLYSIAYSGALGILGVTVLKGAVIANSSAFNALAQLIVVPLIALLMPLFIASVISLFADLLIRRDGSDLRRQLDAL